MASWSLVPLDPRNKASTVGLHVSPLARAADEEVVAVARTLRRNNEIFQNVVEVQGTRSGRRVAVASVTYRIVVPSA
jgi:acyl-coenzyme A thioesterase PaaI-like protein